MLSIVYARITRNENETLEDLQQEKIGFIRSCFGGVASIRLKIPACLSFEILLLAPSFVTIIYKEWKKVETDR